MTQAFLYYEPRARAFSSSTLTVVPNATLTFYLTGTTTLSPIYSTGDTGGSQLANPISADGAGLFPTIYLDPAVIYRVILKTSTGVTLEDNDPVSLKNATATYFAQTAAETSTGVTVVNFNYLPGVVARYGILPNNAAVATANTTILKTLLNPAVVGPTGLISFNNTTGQDVYYFNDLIPVRDGIHIDLQSSTVNFAKTAVAGDSNTGFFTTMRDFILENGSIVINAPTMAPSTSAYGAVFIGARAADNVKYFPAVYDSLLTKPLGNVVLRNLYISTNTAQGIAIQALGGIRDVTIENVEVNGGGVAYGGFYYEFGFATNETNRENRQSSHAYNLQIRNFTVKNLAPALNASAGLDIRGAYSATIENYKCLTASNGLIITTGEALFYRPWAANDLVGAKRGIAARGISCQGLTGTGVSLVGAQLASGGYLSPLGLTAKDEVDLQDLTLENFALGATSAGGYGVQSLGVGKLRICNGTITGGFQRGIVTTCESTNFVIESVNVFANTQYGIQIGQVSSIYATPRLSVGRIANCFIAGNSTSSVGAFAGILAQGTQSLLIEQNRFGYETIHDSIAETTQGAAVQAATVTGPTFGVVCRGNYVAGYMGSYAYYQETTTGGDDGGCRIENPQGAVVTRGIWGGVAVPRTVMTYSASMTIDSAPSTLYEITATNGTAFTLNAPSNAAAEKEIEITIRNASGGALGTATWNAVFKMSTWTQPANGFSRSITFRYNGTNWIEISRTPADVPN